MATNPQTFTELADNAGVLAQMRPVLVRYFKRKTGNVTEAEDLAQDVLVNVLRHANWRSEAQATGYIFRSAVNRWRDRQRKALTHGFTVEWNEAAALGLDEEISPEHVLIVEQALHDVATALLQLNERTRDVFMLIRLEHLKQATVAAMLGVSVSTVEKELVKALAHLARCAARQDGIP